MAFPGTGKIWMNGKLVDWKDATIHIASHVIHYGSGVFEGARCYETVNGPVRTMGITLGSRTITERTMYERRFTAQRTQRIEAARLTMAEFASILAQNTGRPVLDRTGLTGVYRFSIELPSDAFVVTGLLAAGVTTTVQGTPLTEPTGVSTVKAVEGLGLKLEPRRMMLDAIVVDRIERTPTDN